MALSTLSYSKDWSVEDASSSQYFATHEADETQVRADMQLLYNEIRTWANTLVQEELTDATNIGMGESSVIQATDVKGALLELYALIQQISQGAVPNHSISKIKLTDVYDLAGAAVGTDNIENDAITSAKIADNAVIAALIKDGEVTTVKLASDANGVNSAVGTNNIKTGAVTNDKIANYSLTNNKLATTANPNGAAVANDNIVNATIKPTKFNSDVYGTSAADLGASSSAGVATTVSRSDHVHKVPSLAEVTGTLALAKGGSGATTAAGARTAFEVTERGKLKIGSDEYILRLGEISYTPSSASLTITFNQATWITAGLGEGTFVFTYDTSLETASWTYNGSAVSLDTYGLGCAGTPANGDTITVVYKAGLAGYITFVV